MRLPMRGIMSRHSPFIIGIDAGATRCRGKLCDMDMNILADLEIKGASLFQSPDDAIKQVAATIKKLCSYFDKREAPGKIIINVGIAGSGLADRREKLRAAIEHYGDVSITSDYAVVAYGAHAGRKGGLVAIGTGAVTCRTLEDFHAPELVAGGYGFPVSDLGAGAWLGLEAIRSAVLEKQQHADVSRLTHAVLDRFDQKLSNVTRWSVGSSAADYASFAPLVTDAAICGETTACSLMKSALGYIEKYHHQLKELGCERIVLTGGLGQAMATFFSTELKEKFDRPTFDGAAGAAMMARDKINET